MIAQLRACLVVAVVYAIFTAILPSSAAVSDERRVALVIGNSTYKSVAALTNPVNDSADIGRALEGLGFEVEHVSDLTFDNMRRTLRAFSFKASKSDVALVFYAGHGIEMDGQNYLLPIDARIDSRVKRQVAN